MRIDKWLKESRLVKRRTVANEFCDAGRVRINGRAVKAGTNVQVGDIVEIQIGGRWLRLQVLSLGPVRPDQAAALYAAVDSAGEHGGAPPGPESTSPHT